MPHYCIYVLDRHKCVISHIGVACDTYRLACVVAESLLEPGAQVEVWNDTRHLRVASIAKAPADPEDWRLERGMRLQHR